MERETTEGGALGDGVGEIFGLRVFLSEDLEVLFFVSGPVLPSSLAQSEEFLGFTFEVELILLMSNDLGEVSMGVAGFESVDFGGEDGSSASNGFGGEGGEEAS